MDGSSTYETRVVFLLLLASMVKFFHRHLNAVVLKEMSFAGS